MYKGILRIFPDLEQFVFKGGVMLKQKTIIYVRKLREYEDYTVPLIFKLTGNCTLVMAERFCSKQLI